MSKIHSLKRPLRTTVATLHK